MFSMRKEEILIIIGIITACVVLGFFFMNRGEEADYTIQAVDRASRAPVIEEGESVVQKVVVHVTGAVYQPGVYSLSQDSRVFHAVTAAGGAKPDADLDRINLAAPVRDGVQINVPRFIKANDFENVVKEADDNRVNVNMASQAELETLPGIGPARAQAIIQYREEQGSFSQVKDLLKISGIGEKTLEQLTDKVRLY